MRLTLVSLMVIALTGCQTIKFNHSMAPQLPMAKSPASTSDDSANVVSDHEPEQIEKPPAPAPKKIVYNDLWKRLAANMNFDVPLNDRRVQSQLNWFRHHPEYLKRVSVRATPYMYWVVEQLQKRQMPMELALLPIIESAYDPFAYSHGQASGMWQIIPDTATHLGLRRNWWYDGRRDVVASTNAALDYLAWLNKLFDGNWLNAMAAYNSGQGRVLDAIHYNQRHHKQTDFWHLDLPSETEAYVPKLLALSEVIKHPKKYGVQLPNIANHPYLEQVNVGSQIDLALAAKMAHLDLKQLYQLNPGFNRWATDPNGSHKLLIPIENVDQFKTALAQLPANKRVKWKRHQVVSGDTLNKIAYQYHTTTKMISSINHLNTKIIRVGQHLIVPMSVRKPSQYILSETSRLAKLQSRSRPSTIKMHYVVQNGDSLWLIAKKYHLDYHLLAKWNGLSPKDALHTGQNLVLWQKISAKKTGITRRIVYKVRQGDSLDRIAHKFKVQVDDLVKWNDLQHQSYLQPGQKLRVYVDITRLNV
ncbi:LysM peptidoglycan-binding domain-containing protein [Celerinatantimonas yamalensis]|uniref:LysM peptidoglycan-binding domain-containing protein n=1 Tax=Celerinatantimonas yamalensis TaxID=559956 RepID=A0ABW9G9Q6_9GAMM